MLRLALIGCGKHSELQHAAPLARYAAAHPGEIELVAACDLDEEKAAALCRRYGFARAYTNIIELLDCEKPDGCVSVMPVAHIAAVSTLLLRRGVPCVIEKPPAISMEEARQLAGIASQTGTPHMVSMNRRFDPYLNRACEWAQKMGPLRMVRATMVRYARSEDDFIWATGLHAVDAMRHIGGEVACFEVRKSRDAAPDWYEIEFLFQSGARGRLDVLPTAGHVEESYELHGEEYSGRVDIGISSPSRVQFFRKGRLALGLSSAPGQPHDMAVGAYDESCAWINALRKGIAPHPSLHDVLPSLEICFAAFEQTVS